MADPIIEQIMTQVVSALEGISTGAGYETDVSEVYRPKTILGYDTVPNRDFSIQLVLGDPTRDDEQSRMGNPPLIGWDQPIEMNLIYRPSESATEAIETVLNRFWADAIKAIYLDPQWSDLAIDTEITDPQWLINADDGFVGINATVNIEYRHKENNPYEQ
jgi:hypothetical protein